MAPPHPSPPPRLGLLQCPNAASLGWPADGGGRDPGDPPPADGPAASGGRDDGGDGGSAPGTAPGEPDDGSDRAGKRARLGGPSPAGDVPGGRDAAADPGLSSAGPPGDRGESTEPMKGPSHISVSPAGRSPPCGRVTASLDYEAGDGGECCQVLTVRCPASLLGNGAGRWTAFVGSISGRAELEVLKGDGGGGAPWSLDVFGHRPRPGEAVSVDRPEGWTDALPLAVAETAQGGGSQGEETARGSSEEHVLRVRIRSVRDRPGSPEAPAAEDGDTGPVLGHYGTRQEETYGLRLLPPGEAVPGNFGAGGRRRTTAVLRGWSEAMDAAAAGDAGEEEGGRYLVCGAKGVGKSTLVRYVANRLLSGDGDCGEPGREKRRVAVLDLDCGQPELGPPGMLTLTVLDGPLLSEPPVHMARRNRGGGSEGYEETPIEHAAAHYLGDVSSRSDPDAYVAMVASLARRYESLRLERRGSGSLPLVVNTDGWVKGLGGEVLSAAIASCRPRRVLQINGGTRAKSFELPPRIGAAGVTVSVFPSYDCEEAGQAGCCPSGGASTDDEARPGGPSDGSSPRASASDRREHRLVSYLLGGSLPAGVAFGREHGLSDPDDAIGDALARTRPYAVPLGCVDLYPSPGFLDGASPGECVRLRGARGDLVSEDVVESFSGAVVGLCSSGRQGEGSAGPSRRVSAGAGPPVLDCVGLGVIRAADVRRGVLYVLTPVRPGLLADVDALVAGDGVRLPLGCVYRGVRSESLANVSVGHSVTSTSLGADVMRSRNRSRGK